MKVHYLLIVLFLIGILVVSGCGKGKIEEIKQIKKAIEGKPSTTGAPSSLAKAVILDNHGTYIVDGRHHHFLGEIKNTGSTNLKQFEVLTTLYDSEDKEIKKQGPSIVSSRVLEPGEKIPFAVSILLPEGTEVASYKLKLSSVRGPGYKETSQKRYKDIEILEHSEKRSATKLEVTGKIKNTGNEKRNYVEVTGAFYSSDGTIVAVGNMKELSFMDFEPGNIASFTVYVLDVEHLSAPVDTYTLYVTSSPSYS